LSDAINPEDLRPGTIIRKNKKAIGSISDQEIHGVLGIDIQTHLVTKSMFQRPSRLEYAGISEWTNPRACGDIY
jgi:hypothetical protein